MMTTDEHKAVITRRNVLKVFLLVPLSIVSSPFGAEWTEVPAKITRLTPDQAAKALSEGYAKVTGHKPSKKVLGLLISQTALETGNWNSIWNYNFGNAKASARDKYIQYFRCSEIINGVEQFFDPPDFHCRFAAFKTASDGAKAYIELLKSRPNWWNGLHTGDIGRYISGLTAPLAYFTANKSLYQRVMTERLSKYQKLASEYSGIGLAGGLAIAGVAGLTYYGIKKHA